ncbi:glucoamylase family protein [Cyclobacterium sp. 1_MG-2023]|uniref:glucoamylase family protein n=1 Tax=Cyclobacterium sp. 1_MG-2023 TaxID=3062681 RepID=UPI0026E1BD3F|nr:glucoamylase family protein [Cyclobacterium sp. 1_MG-2023]MDO6436958.1 glucoamylase family protein [Cyclobacterium sp. 1_MG-2023]
MKKTFNAYFIILGIGLLVLGCAEKEVSSNRILAKGYARHVELQWEPVLGAESYTVFVKKEDSDYTERASIKDTIYLDFVNDLGTELTLSYKVEAQLKDDTESLGEATVATRSMSDEELLDMVQYYTFRYFWEGAEPNSGMARERIHIDGNYPQNDQNVVTTGGTGFGLFGLIAGIERAWVSREEGFKRFERIVDFLAKADRFHGVWSHWIHGENGKVKPFGSDDDGGDLVESAFLMQGLLAVREYYKNGNEQEKALALKIDELWEAMDWTWYTQGGQDILYWHWSPNFGWQKNFGIKGYDECMITYVLAASSPTHAVPASVYHKGWARDGDIVGNTEAYGHQLPLKHNGSPEYGGPLFWSHYSYLGLDPRGLADKYANYWENNRNHSLINRQWCVENEGGFKGYGKDLWGLTASYTVTGYAAHKPGSDLGVISPTAALSSIPYTPEESMAVIRNLYYNYGEKVFGRYGFYDALSPEKDWYPQRYLAIDQGPIVAMIENYRTGLGWDLFMAAPEVQEGLDKLGFTVSEE